MIDNTEYLYHYTNVNALSMILKTQSIKFTPLTELDDLEEEKIKDIKPFAKYVYISSWTDDVTESIPMWKMYTSDMNGVRIKLPKSPFKEYNITKNDFGQTKYKNIFEKSSFNIFSLMQKDEYIYSDYLLLGNKLDILHQVKYTNDIEKLYPKVETIIKDRFKFDFGDLGIYKNKYWDFQHEWRYVLLFHPYSFSDILEYNNHPEKIYSNVDSCVDLPFSKYFLKIDNDNFKDMEITLSPKIDEGTETIVQALVEKYNPSAKIIKSTLKGLIR